MNYERQSEVKIQEKITAKETLDSNLLPIILIALMSHASFSAYMYLYHPQSNQHYS